MRRPGEGAVVAGQTAVAGADGGAGRPQRRSGHRAAERRRAERRSARIIGLRRRRTAVEVTAQRVVVRRGGARRRRCRRYRRRQSLLQDFLARCNVNKKEQVDEEDDCGSRLRQLLTVLEDAFDVQSVGGARFVIDAAPQVAGQLAGACVIDDAWVVLADGVYNNKHNKNDNSRNKFQHNGART